MNKVAIVDELHLYKNSGMHHSTIATKKALEISGLTADIVAIAPHGKLLSRLILTPYLRDFIIFPTWNLYMHKRLKDKGYGAVFYRNTTSTFLLPRASFRKVVFTSTLLARQLMMLKKMQISGTQKLAAHILYPACFVVEKISFRNADKVVASKQRFKDYIVDNYKVEAQTISVLPQIIDSDLKPVKAKKKYDLLFIGRMSLPKNWPIVESIAEQSSYSILVLSPEADKYGDSNKNITVKSKVPYDQLAKEICSAKVFIMPSHMETGPRVTLEAMSCGLPVVASPEGSGGFLENVKNGYVIETNDAKDYIAAIEKLIKNPTVYAEVSKNNVAKSHEYTTEFLASEYRKAVTT